MATAFHSDDIGGSLRAEVKMFIALIRGSMNWKDLSVEDKDQFCLILLMFMKQHNFKDRMRPVVKVVVPRKSVKDMDDSTFRFHPEWMSEEKLNKLRQKVKDAHLSGQDWGILSNILLKREKNPKNFKPFATLNRDAALAKLRTCLDENRKPWEKQAVRRQADRRRLKISARNSSKLAALPASEEENNLTTEASPKTLGADELLEKEAINILCSLYVTLIDSTYEVLMTKLDEREKETLGKRRASSILTPRIQNQIPELPEKSVNLPVNYSKSQNRPSPIPADFKENIFNSTEPSSIDAPETSLKEVDGNPFNIREILQHGKNQNLVEDFKSSKKSSQSSVNFTEKLKGKRRLYKLPDELALYNSWKKTFKLPTEIGDGAYEKVYKYRNKISINRFMLILDFVSEPGLCWFDSVLNNQIGKLLDEAFLLDPDLMKQWCITDNKPEKRCVEGAPVEAEYSAFIKICLDLDFELLTENLVPEYLVDLWINEPDPVSCTLEVDESVGVVYEDVCFLEKWEVLVMKFIRVMIKEIRAHGKNYAPRNLVMKDLKDIIYSESVNTYFARHFRTSDQHLVSTEKKQLSDAGQNDRGGGGTKDNKGRKKGSKRC